MEVLIQDSFPFSFLVSCLLTYFLQLQGTCTPVDQQSNVHRFTFKWSASLDASSALRLCAPGRSERMTGWKTHEKSSIHVSPITKMVDVSSRHVSFHSFHRGMYIKHYRFKTKKTLPICLDFFGWSGRKVNAFTLQNQRRFQHRHKYGIAKGMFP